MKQLPNINNCQPLSQTKIKEAGLHELHNYNLISSQKMLLLVTVSYRQGDTHLQSSAVGGVESDCIQYTMIANYQYKLVWTTLA